jgi:hypothetical protein
MVKVQLGLEGQPARAGLIRLDISVVGIGVWMATRSNEYSLTLLPVESLVNYNVRLAFFRSSLEPDLSLARLMPVHINLTYTRNSFISRFSHLCIHRRICRLLPIQGDLYWIISRNSRYFVCCTFVANAKLASYINVFCLEINMLGISRDLGLQGESPINNDYFVDAWVGRQIVENVVSQLNFYGLTTPRNSATWPGRCIAPEFDNSTDWSLFQRISAIVAWAFQALYSHSHFRARLIAYSKSESLLWLIVSLIPELPGAGTPC